jgi:hypothetical protein
MNPTTNHLLADAHNDDRHRDAEHRRIVKGLAAPSVQAAPRWWRSTRPQPRTGAAATPVPAE